MTARNVSTAELISVKMLIEIMKCKRGCVWVGGVTNGILKQQLHTPLLFLQYAPSRQGSFF